MQDNPARDVNDNAEGAVDVSRKGVNRLLVWPIIIFFLLVVFVLGALFVVRQSNPTNAGTQGSVQAGG